MATFQRIHWRELGRLMPGRITNYKAISSEPHRSLFLGLLLQTRGPRAVEQTSFTYCFILKKTVEVDWSDFAEVIEAAIGKRG